MPFNRPPLDLLIARSAASMQSRLPGTDAVLRRSLSGIVARMSAGTEHGLYGYLDWLARQLMPDTAEEEHLERWASIWGVSRKAAGHASGDVSITGTPGAVLPEGTICLRSDAVRYAVVSDATVGEDGTGTAFLSAVDAGTEGNAPIGTILALASPVSGLDSQTQATDGLTGGTDEETDESLKSRLLATIQRTPMGGTQADYEQWALEVPGVTRAFVTQEMGRGTVTVRFMMDDTYPDGVPKDGDRQAVAAHIETVRPVTADVYVVLPVADPLNLRLRITPDTAAIRLAAEANLWAAVRRDAVPGGTVFLSRLHEALSLTEKEEDHVILSPTANVTPETGHIVVPGSIEWVTE